LVSPLPPAPWALAPQRDIEIRDVLKRYAQYHPEICQILRILQVNKRHSQNHGHVPPKLVITAPWKVLCIDLIGLYTLKGKDSSSIDFMCHTMIDPATSWFEIMELTTVTKEMTVPTTGKGKKVTFSEKTQGQNYF
jgi:hypothetical protein